MKLVHRFVCGAILIMGFSVPSSAQFGQAVWDTLTADTLRDALTPQSLAVNGYEEYHLAYAKQRASQGWDIYYRFFHLFQGAYPERIAESDMPCFGPVVASRFSDNNYDVIILFESSADIWGCIIHGPHEPWAFRNLTNSADADMSPTVAFGANLVHGAWITETDSGFKISYMCGAADTTHSEIIENSELGPYGSGAQPFIIAPLDVPHIFYRGVNGDNYHIHHAWKVHPDSSWQIEYLSTPNADDYSATAVTDLVGDMHLAISGNDGFGFPGHVYYLKLDHEGGTWTNPELVTGQYSVTNASISVRMPIVYIASCGVDGNIYDGHVYLSNDSSGTFQTQLLGVYQSVTQPLIANITYEDGVLVFDAAIGADEGRNVELVSYGPDLESVGMSTQRPSNIGYDRCYPNPFNARANIEFALSRPGRVKIEIYDLLGGLIDSPLDEYRDAGKYTITWDAGSLPSGLYFYKIQAGEYVNASKMVLLK